MLAPSFVTKNFAFASLAAFAMWPALNSNVAFARPYTLFDVPGCQLATLPSSITDEGVVAGSCESSPGQFSGFVRDTAGNVSILNYGQSYFILTGINSNKLLTGYVSELQGNYEGLTKKGSKGPQYFHPDDSVNTYPFGVNSRNQIAGSFTDANGLSHGFFRYRGYLITEFDEPQGDAGTTTVSALNDKSEITGAYMRGGVSFGYLRHKTGKFETVNPDGSLGTQTSSISDDGTVGGAFQTGSSLSGFLRKPNDSYITFAAPVDGGNILNTFVNKDGKVAGTFSDASGESHGYLRNGKGKITAFDAPGGDNGTVVTAINAYGTVVGTFYDANGIGHGFIRTD